VAFGASPATKTAEKAFSAMQRRCLVNTFGTFNVAIVTWVTFDFSGRGLSYDYCKLRTISKKNRGRAVTKDSKADWNEHRLLRLHKRHLGLYARVADELGVSPSYVSLVANGMRQSEKIREALLAEIAQIHASFR
jgi:hypothetical protein